MTLRTIVFDGLTVARVTAGVDDCDSANTWAKRREALCVRYAGEETGFFD